MAALKHNDITLKHLTMAPDSAFFRLSAKSALAHSLPTEIQINRSLFADNIALLEDGTIWHIEFQSHNDSEMPWRMFQYKSGLLMRYRKKDRSFPVIKQRVYFTGIGRSTMPSRFQVDGVALEFEVIDLKGQFDGGQQLLSSQSPMDKILGLLCMPLPHDETGISSYERHWQKVANSLRTPIRSGMADAQTLFEFAAYIRDVDLKRIKGWTAMPITADLNHTVLAKQIYEQGIEKGHAQGYERGVREFVTVALEARQTPLNVNQQTMLDHLDADELKVFSERVARGETIDQAFKAVASRQQRPDPGYTR